MIHTYLQYFLLFANAISALARLIDRFPITNNR